MEGSATFPIVDADSLIKRHRAGIPLEVRLTTQRIVSDVRDRGEIALKEYVTRFDKADSQQDLYRSRDELQGCLDSLDRTDRDRLERIAGQIETFARAQRQALTPIAVSVPGGRAGHNIQAVERAGCYAPGGRYPLPSSVLMTVITARVAGVGTVWVASPRPAPITLAAAALAGADGLLAAGGAHAIAALAYGAGRVPAADIVVGPGNEFVTAAKQIVMGDVAIDMLAGPSELVIVGDRSSDPGLIAADLLAQAEHDSRALPVLVTVDRALIDAVRREISTQLETLPTADTAAEALRNGGAILCESLEEVVEVCNRIAPEHLQLSAADPTTYAQQIKNYGAIFVGEQSAEVFGDYGVGPNHVLPTDNAARYSGGLSVFNFLRIRTWLEQRDAADPELISDSAWLARKEGLEAHARAAERRIVDKN